MRAEVLEADIIFHFIHVFNIHYLFAHERHIHVEGKPEKVEMPIHVLHYHALVSR